ncbi:PTS transporter subunit EIIC [Streptococcus pasteurianus]|uniref:PTS transporter subunit EIIC n=1 Tax=Streptococcus pasteurianus TaxID=197614 RepID=UPI0025533468|nr:PTS transporter subunit EIIC [Streptococcus pasteurianus]MDK8394478.1 PTS transporter subunit EIIC [Streptococcus pasteurianus]
MVDNNKVIAEKVLAAVGGKENVMSATHCMTRLRLNLKDTSVPKKDEVTSIPGVLAVVESGGQYQVVIGQNVAKVYPEFAKLAGVTLEKQVDENLDKPKEKLTLKGVGTNILDYLSGSLTPLIPVMLTASLFKTLVAILGPSLLNVLSESGDLYTLFTFVGDAGFYFFPVFLGYTAAKKLNTNIPIALFLGAILIHPAFLNIATERTSFSVFGIPTTAQNYSSTVIPMILVVWILKYVYNFFKKYTPDLLSVFVVPFATVLVMLPLSLSILAPLGGYIGTYIGEGIIALNSVAAPLALAVVGGFFTFFVLTGMHPVLFAYLFVTFPTMGYDNFLLPGILCASWSAAGVALACIVKIKNQKERSLAIGYLVTWFFGGVGEPMLYGLFIPYKTPLLAGIISGALTGLVAGMVHLTAYVLNTSNGIYGLAAFLGGSSSNYIALGITIAVSLISGFLIMMFTKLGEKV